MFDKKVVAYTGAGKQARGWHVLSQQDARVLARVGEPGARVVGISNGKRLWIDLRGEACKERVTTSALGCNIVGARPGQSSFCARPPASL